MTPALALVLFSTFLVFAILYRNCFRSSRIPSSPTKESNTEIENISIITKEESIYVKNRNAWIKEKTELVLSKKSINQLVDSKQIKYIGYSDLLNCMEWQLKRLRILIRDKYTCQDCDTKGLKLEVHHQYYLKDHLPWDINDEALIGLCRTCHKERHQKERIPVFEKFGNKLQPAFLNNIYCTRCLGSGYIPEFKHIQEGICFQCNGNTVNSTVFSKSLSKIKSSNKIKSDDIILDEIITFFSSVSIELFENKTIFVEEMLVTDDLPF